MSSVPANSPTEETEHGAVWDFLHDMPAWGISLLVHVAILLVALMIPVAIETYQATQISAEVAPEIEREEEYVIDTEVSDDIGSQSDLNIAGASVAVAQKAGLDNHLEVTPQFTEAFVNPELDPVQQLMTPNEAEMLENLDLTGTTEHAGGTAGAIDAITLEIAASVKQRETLVVWMMDESKSMEKRREEVAKRFRNIYQQLGQLDIGADEALHTGIVSYGKDTHYIVEEPGNDVDQLAKAVESIQNDPSGDENVCNAIAGTLRKFASAKRKLKASMMLILVTDERGDDYAALEDVVRRCAREGIKIYCIGNASVFGREKGQVYMKWEADGEEYEGYLDADMGPETVRAEGLQLPFWTAKANGLEQMSAGYGPYTLSRMCVETGGVFYLAEDTRKFNWDPSVMRRYAPDYRPVKYYVAQLAQNAAKSALIKAAEMAPLDGNPIPIPTKTFLATNDNVLRQEITEAQRPMAEVDYFLQRLQNTLEAGERDRDKLDSDRWRAGYDLAMGRVLAMRVRAFGYNSVLANMKASPKSFTKDGNNEWKLKPSETINGGAQVRKLNKKATEYLNRVIDEHPGTPWAYLASVEIGDPLGWEWVESKRFIPKANMNNGNNNNRPQFAPEDEERRRQERRRQQMKKNSQPKI